MGGGETADPGTADPRRKASVCVHVLFSCSFLFYMYFFCLFCLQLLRFECVLYLILFVSFVVHFGLIVAMYMNLFYIYLC